MDFTATTGTEPLRMYPGWRALTIRLDTMAWELFGLT